MWQADPQCSLIIPVALRKRGEICSKDPIPILKIFSEIMDSEDADWQFCWCTTSSRSIAQWLSCDPDRAGGYTTTFYCKVVLVNPQVSTLLAVESSHHQQISSMQPSTVKASLPSGQLGRSLNLACLLADRVLQPTLSSAANHARQVGGNSNQGHAPCGGSNQIQ